MCKFGPIAILVFLAVLNSCTSNLNDSTVVAHPIGPKDILLDNKFIDGFGLTKDSKYERFIYEFSGTVGMKLEIKSSGVIGKAEIINKDFTPDFISDLLLKNIHQVKFEPTRVSGNPITDDVEIKIVFRLL